jgi:hypothetical protein
MRLLIVTSLSVLAALAVNAAEPVNSCVTMVADLYGPVTVASQAGARREDKWPVQLMKCLPAGKVLTLENGARATLFFPATGAALELGAPGGFEITADGARPLANALPPTRMLLNDAFRKIEFDRTNLSAAGVRMRDPALGGLGLLQPRGIVLSAHELVFHWEPSGDQRNYRFRLATESRQVIFEQVTEQTQLALPQDVHLASGKRLLWQVQTLSASSAAPSRWQEFIIATPEARALAAQIDPELATPSAAERNLRDMLLMQRMVGTQKQRAGVVDSVVDDLSDRPVREH